jgi:hypothetical protein
MDLKHISFSEILTTAFSQFANFREYLLKLINFATLYEIYRRISIGCFTGKLWRF